MKCSIYDYKFIYGESMAKNLIERLNRKISRWLALNKDYINARGELKAHVENSSLPIQDVLSQAECTFVMSTGRCGTELLTYLLSPQSKLQVTHNPKHELVALSRKMYEYSFTNDHALLEFATLHARYDLILESFRRGRQIIETNNRITFYCPYLARLFTRSKFIHLVRHPGDFVRSGLRRGFYVDGNAKAMGLLEPSEQSEIASKWNHMSQIEKVSWLWNETNQFIEKARLNIPDDRFLFVRSEDLFSSIAVTRQIFSFVDVSPRWSEKKINRVLRTPLNAQTSGEIPNYSDWSKEDQDQVRSWVTPLASQYGYSL